ncbi:MAG: hypothetical protein EP338_08285 [Bacteroidetes bacterium]|nr:MAG: hypothetical protein EP338_08285 [Bacteroidota bacterium]
MKINSIAFILVLLLSTTAFGQKVKYQINKDMELKIKSDNGNNGLAVVYNKKKKIYYTIYAGNKSYPLEVHDLSGTSVYQMRSDVDARGMWYDKKCNCLMGTVYGNAGSYEIELNADGMPVRTTENSKTYNFDGQGVAVAGKKYIYHMAAGGSLVKVHKKSGAVSQISIKDAYPKFYNLNVNGIVYTGIKGHEIGLVNATEKKLVLFNAKTGKMAANIQINADGADVSGHFRVSFANGRLFLYQGNTRSWYGYKVSNK